MRVNSSKVRSGLGSLFLQSIAAEKRRNTESKESEEEMSALIKCTACGREISANAVACPHCGEPRAEAQPKPKQTATGCLAALLIGLIIGLALYFMITMAF
jgi:predicted RNA-binding Zn-ribbon protein involved in translation (DUF1610 family)